MSVYSMTGYAAVQHSSADSPGGAEARSLPAARLGLEIRSVNSRFLDLSFRLSDELRQHEPALRELMTRRLKRGKVEVRAGIETSGPSSISEPSTRLLQRLNAVQDNVRAWLPDARPLSVSDVIRLSAGENANTTELGKELLPLAARALEALLEAREREGARLARMLQDRISQLQQLAATGRAADTPVGGTAKKPVSGALERSHGAHRWRHTAGSGARSRVDGGHRVRDPD